MLRRLFGVPFAILASPVFAGGVSIVIDISNQSMAVSIGGDRQEGFRTPTGTYHPTRMLLDLLPWRLRHPRHHL